LAGGGKGTEAGKKPILLYAGLALLTLAAIAAAVWCWRDRVFRNVADLLP